MVSPSTYASRIRTYGQSFSTACFDHYSDEKPKVEMKTNSDYAPDRSVMLANGFWNGTAITTWYLYLDIFESYLVSNYFHFFIHVLVCNNVMFYTVVSEFEILCEQEIP